MTVQTKNPRNKHCFESYVTLNRDAPLLNCYCCRGCAWPCSACPCCPWFLPCLWFSSRPWRRSAGVPVGGQQCGPAHGPHLQPRPTSSHPGGARAAQAAQSSHDSALRQLCDVLLSVPLTVTEPNCKLSFTAGVRVGKTQDTELSVPPEVSGIHWGSGKVPLWMRGELLLSLKRKKM